MTDRQFKVGDKALVSRDESGENHEEATVVDAYVLLIGEETRPMVVVDFDDGERKWIAAAEPNVVSIEPEPDEPEEGSATAEHDDERADEIQDGSENGDEPDSSGRAGS